MTEPGAIPVLTLWQPHASLVALVNPETGLPWKTIETRGWATKYRGPLAIHAAARVVYGPVGHFRAETWFSDVQHIPDRCYCDEGEVGPPCDRGASKTPCLTRAGTEPLMLPLRAIVATCNLIDVAPIGGERRFRSANWMGDEQELQDRTVCVVTDGSYDRPRVCLDRPNERPSVLDVSDQEPYGDFTPGRYAWLLADVVPVDPPVPFRGGQGLTKRWTPTTAVA